MHSTLFLLAGLATGLVAGHRQLYYEGSFCEIAAKKDLACHSLGCFCHALSHEDLSKETVDICQATFITSLCTRSPIPVFPERQSSPMIRVGSEFQVDDVSGISNRVISSSSSIVSVAAIPSASSSSMPRSQRLYRRAMRPEFASESQPQPESQSDSESLSHIQLPVIYKTSTKWRTSCLCSTEQESTRVAMTATPTPTDTATATATPVTGLGAERMSTSASSASSTDVPAQEAPTPVETSPGSSSSKTSVAHGVIETGSSTTVRPTTTTPASGSGSGSGSTSLHTPTSALATTPTASVAEMVPTGVDAQRNGGGEEEEEEAKDGEKDHSKETGGKDGNHPLQGVAPQSVPRFMGVLGLTGVMVAVML
ncbi:hypothetical protein FE257_012530 [Aspergillus nanangensis]|uniref:Extracellular membrane protein CFEM domain-containing protein n=1 Tax=Aspergillus nanangensis TaxID=2582783 RepID=A0AAD4CUS8_ASPNN|nr:hypothetical protein FE257_012530 [Aspergillus nanangensis]